MARKLFLALASLVASLALLEVGFSLFHVEPDGFRHTRAAQRWLERYWIPINSLGYRDVEHDLDALAAARRVFVVGDSFAAADGLPDIQDRFSSRLAERLGPPWSVVLLAQPGWNTAHQQKALAAFPLSPHVLVVSYYLNDIEGAAQEHGRTFEIDLSVRPAWLQGAVERSNLLNFVYWRLARSQFWSLGEGYADYVYDAFRDPAVWQTHAAELDALITPARQRGTLVVAVVFPHLFDIEGSADAVDQVIAHFEDASVPVVDVRELVRAAGLSPAERLAGPMDPHPSAAVHRLVGDALFGLVAP